MPTAIGTVLASARGAEWIMPRLHRSVRAIAATRSATISSYFGVTPRISGTSLQCFRRQTTTEDDLTGHRGSFRLDPELLDERPPFLRIGLHQRVNKLGVCRPVGKISTPRFASRDCTAGSANAWTVAPLSRPMISAKGRGYRRASTSTAVLSFLSGRYPNSQPSLTCPEDRATSAGPC
jgi:hypothetical protein